MNYFARLGAFACIALPLWSVAMPRIASAMPGERHPVQLNASQAFALAQRSEAKGAHDVAASIYLALTKDPAAMVRAEARFRLARLLADQGRLPDAAIELRRLIDEQPHVAAARIGLAQMLAQLGDIDGARRQLRSAQADPLPRNVARLTERYANALRSRAPYGWSVEASLAPDSNINRATTADQLSTVIGDFQLSPDAKARSGVGLNLSGDAFVRLPLNDNLRWVTRVHAHSSQYRDTAFSQLGLSASTGAEQSLGSTRLAIDAGVALTTFGGKTYQRLVQGSVQAYRPLGARTALAATLAGARVINVFNRLQSGLSVSGGMTVDRSLAVDKGVRLIASGNRFSARDAGFSTCSWELGFGGWIDLGRLTFSATAAHGGLSADRKLNLFPQRRHDRVDRIVAGITTRHVRVLGFSPLVRFTIERNRSTIEIWDYDRRRFEFGLTRSY